MSLSANMFARLKEHTIRHMHVVLLLTNYVHVQPEVQQLVWLLSGL